MLSADVFFCQGDVCHNRCFLVDITTELICFWGAQWSKNQCSDWLGCFVLLPFISTRKACWFMNTNHFTTFGTIPFQFFTPSEISDPNFIYLFKIVDHAHPILCSISLIQLFQHSTGKISTNIRAILYFAVGDLLAVSDYACTTVF